MKNVAFHNLGCKVDSYEMDFVQQILREKGYNVVAFWEKADIYIINTCTVTNIADRKSRQMLHRARAMNPDAVVVAMGCYVQTGQEEALKDACIDLAIGNNRKKDIVRILEEYLEERDRRQKGLQQEEASRDKTPQDKVFQDNPTQDKVFQDKTLGGSTVIDIGHTYEYEEMQLKKTAEHTRAYIKIQDGCNQFCSYCIIPYARGRVRSRRREDILREIRGMIEAGYREVVLTGIHISSYGIDLAEGEQVSRGDYRGHSGLIELVEELQRLEGLARIRLGSLEPRIVTEEFASRLAACDKVCPHFHLSLQSGCDATLKRMNRHYTTGEYFRSVEQLRRAFDHPAITTDVIVGFPGETEEEFAETRAFLEKIQFYETHVFKYSRRKGTRAAVMEDQVSDGKKAERSNILLELNRRNREAYENARMGKQDEVLFEECVTLDGESYYTGHTREYVRMAVPAEEGLANKILPVRVGKSRKQGLLTAEISKSFDCIFA